MISVICVYNDLEKVNKYLISSLNKQQTQHELILVNNTQGIYKSASEALNYGASLAHGDYFMFAHQDIELPDGYWLERTEEILKNNLYIGIAGIAGSAHGWKYGYLEDANGIWGEPIGSPVIIQTLDECILIVKSWIFKEHKFDEKNFDGWHCYAADYALSAREAHFGVYVIPNFLYHRNSGKNLKDLDKYLLRLYLKHPSQRPIYIAGNGVEITPKLILSMKLSPYYRFFKKMLS